MGKKLFAIAALLTAFAVTGFADYIKIDLNFWGSDAEIVPVDKLPDGVALWKKLPFHNKNLYGFAHPIMINLDKVQKIDIKFVIKGKAGTIKPSLMLCRRKDGKLPVIECPEFVFNDEASPKVPFQCTGWTGMGVSAEVSDGDTITLKAEFKSADK